MRLKHLIEAACIHAADYNFVTLDF